MVVGRQVVVQCLHIFFIRYGHMVLVPDFHLSKNWTENRFHIPVHTVNRMPVHKTRNKIDKFLPWAIGQPLVSSLVRVEHYVMGSSGKICYKLAETLRRCQDELFCQEGEGYLSTLWAVWWTGYNTIYNKNIPFPFMHPIPYICTCHDRYAELKGNFQSGSHICASADFEMLCFQYTKSRYE